MILRAGILYDGTLESPKRNVDVVIEHGRIAAVRAAEGDSDLAAACVTPGLVNAHVHLEASGEPDLFTMVQTTMPNERLLKAVANARKSLRAGVTTVRDLGSSNAIAQSLRDAIDAGTIPGPRMRAAGNVLCMTGGHGWPIGREIVSPWDARTAVREQLKAGADCIKVIATGGVLTKGAVPGNEQLCPDELAFAIDEAHRHGLRTAAHAIGAAGIKSALRANVDSIEHGMLIDEEGVALLKERGAYLVPTLAAAACILEHLEDGTQPGYVVEKARKIGEVMEENLRRAVAAGVRIAGGSDAGTPYNYHERYAYEVELMHRVLGMTPQQALHAATAVAAELVGIHRGRVAPGEPADVLLLERDAGADVRALREPVMVLKGGEVIA
ncbi:MAG: amidohydrolase family protein [Candidatus Eremiobacteraeota bacterium]|nr:amidohydrolase family protein [Candidatus Eremiobacteraeota bacterium]